MTVVVSGCIGEVKGGEGGCCVGGSGGSGLDTPGLRHYRQKDH